MKDYSELKRLSEAATPGPWFDDDGFVRAESGLDIVESHSGCPMRPSDTVFVAAANPVNVLALIAENERIKARLCVCRECGGCGEIYSGHSTYQSYNQPPEPDMDVCGTCGGDGVLGPVEDFEALASDRDHLKHELSELRKFHSSQVEGLREKIKAFVNSAYPVSTEIDPRGYRWSDAWLDEALAMIPDLKP